MSSSTSTLVYVDPRLPVDPTMSIHDPAHPRNLVANLAALEAQAQADTVYDGPPPKRDKPLLEAFTVYGSDQQTAVLVAFLLGFLVLLSFAVKRKGLTSGYMLLPTLALAILFALGYIVRHVLSA